MKNKEKISACLLCGSNDQKILFSNCIDYEYWVNFSAGIAQCKSCGLVFQNPKPYLEDLPRYYPESYANYSKPRSLITRILMNVEEYLNAKEVINLIGKTGTILDVGCGDGNYLDYMRKLGKWEIHGTDINKEAVLIVRKKGFVVYRGELENLDIPENTYSIVRMNHLLEHVINPLTTLEKISKILKPGGYLIIETPNTASPDFHILKKYWGALHLPRHIHFFNEKTMRLMLDKSGFFLRKVTHTLMTTGWALGIQNYLQSKKRRSLINGRASYYPFLLLTFLPIVVVQKMFRCSTMIRFLAQKNS